MKASFKIVVQILIIAVISHLSVLYIAPGIIMDRVMAALGSGALAVASGHAQLDELPAARYFLDSRLDAIKARGGWNVAMPGKRPDHTSRTVVRPSPDLTYTSCLFDVSQKPLHLTAPVSDSYMSLSGFAANTDNFFAINDSQIVANDQGEKRFNVVIFRGEIDSETLPAGATLIEAPSDQGIILFRSLITHEQHLDALYQLQAQQRCDPLG